MITVDLTVGLMLRRLVSIERFLLQITSRTILDHMDRVMKSGPIGSRFAN